MLRALLAVAALSVLSISCKVRSPESAQLYSSSSEPTVTVNTGKTSETREIDAANCFRLAGADKDRLEYDPACLRNRALVQAARCGIDVVGELADNVIGDKLASYVPDGLVQEVTKKAFSLARDQVQEATGVKFDVPQTISDAPTWVNVIDVGPGFVGKFKLALSCGEAAVRGLVEAAGFARWANDVSRKFDVPKADSIQSNAGLGQRVHASEINDKPAGATCFIRVQTYCKAGNFSSEVAGGVAEINGKVSFATRNGCEIDEGASGTADCLGTTYTVSIASGQGGLYTRDYDHRCGSNYFRTGNYDYFACR